MAAKKQAAAADAAEEPADAAVEKPKRAKKPEKVEGRYPVGPLARKADETDSEFEARRQAEYPAGVHDPIINRCAECGTIPPQGFELLLVQEDGSVQTMHNAPAKPVAYQAMLAHYKFAHPDSKVPVASDELDIPDPDLMAELLDRTRNADGRVVNEKAKPAGFAA